MESTLNNKAWVTAGLNSCVQNKTHAKRIENYLTQNNWILTDKLSDADIVIYSGCGNFKNYEKKALAEIEHIQNKLNNSNNNAKLVVTGCLPEINNNSKETYNNKTLSDIPGIMESPIIEMYKLDSLIKARTTFKNIPHPNQVEQNDLINEQNFNDSLLKDLPTKILVKFYRILQRIFLKIENSNLFKKNSELFFATQMELAEKGYDILMIGTGCRNNCSYCAEHFSKGRTSSITQKKIMDRLQKRIQEGQRKFFVICDDLGSWGGDLRSHWTTLIKGIVSLDEDYKIALSNLGVYDMVSSEREIKEIISSKKISYIDLTMQHVNKNILRKMNRRYTNPEKIISLINWMSEFNVQINCHLITGFPGETEEEFSEVMEFISKVENKNFLALPFCYSPRPGTPANQRYEDIEIDKEIAQNRLDTIKKTNENKLKKIISKPYKWKISSFFASKVNELTFCKLNIDNKIIPDEKSFEINAETALKEDREPTHLKI